MKYGGGTDGAWQGRRGLSGASFGGVFHVADVGGRFATVMLLKRNTTNAAGVQIKRNHTYQYPALLPSVLLNKDRR